MLYEHSLLFFYQFSTKFVFELAQQSELKMLQTVSGRRQVRVGALARKA
jgi:hypothetical protein